MNRLCLFLTLLQITAFGQAIPHRPNFTDYTVKQVYKGPPAAPILSKDQRTFRTMIRTGAKSDVEFAGHYTVPMFGCGAECSAFFIVDSVTGRVYDEFSVSALPEKWLEKQSGDPPDRFQFEPSSRLFKVNGCPNEQDCGYYDYVMVDGKGLKLVQKWLLPKEYQY
jgi:hypothetical protein